MTETSWEIVGDNLIFTDTEGQKWEASGNIDNSVSFEGNIRIIGDNIYYKDFDENIRKLPSDFQKNLSGKPSVWSEGQDLAYIDEDGEEKYYVDSSVLQQK